MGRDADRAEPQHQILGDPVVEHALAGDHALLLVVEGGRVVLEVLDQGAGLRSLEEDLGLALVDGAATALATVHGGEAPKGMIGTDARAPGL